MDEYIKNINVIDNFLEEKELNEAKKIIRDIKWNYYHKSLSKNHYETNFWVHDLQQNYFFSSYIKEIIEKYFDKKFELLRVYAAAQTYGQEGAFHKDDDRENTYTFCLYFNELEFEYIEIANGYIQFKVPNEKFKLCFEPINNRGILFPSTYIHKGGGFTRFITDIRIVVTFKLKELK